MTKDTETLIRLPKRKQSSHDCLIKNSGCLWLSLTSVFTIVLIACFTLLWVYISSGPSRYPGSIVQRLFFRVKAAGTNVKQECAITDERKFDCHPEVGATKSICASRGCCWKPTTPSASNLNSVSSVGVPSCFYPLNYTEYHVGNISRTSDKITAFLSRNTSSYYKEDVKLLKLVVTYESSYRIHIKIYDPLHPRYEVPVEINKPAKIFGSSSAASSFDIKITESPFSFQVYRKDGHVKLLDTSVGGFIFADQFLQLSTLLPSRYVYGLGEHRATLLHSLNWTRVTLWNKDRPPVEHSNLYGSHPFYLVMEEDGRSHGVFLLNSNAMDVILQPAPAITWRAIGGILDFYIFTGPSPANVISQYTELIGRPFMPPYWSLGFHICRYGYKSVNQTLDVALRTHAAGIPQDVQWDDLDYSYGWMDFTYDAERFGDVPGLARTLHGMGMHYMMIFDPGLSNSQPIGSYLPYDYGIELDLFIKDNVTGKPLVGKVWPGTTVWVDWTHPKAQKYWTTLVTGFHNQVDFDGMWVDMNEPSNMVNGAVDGCPKNSSLENPPYVPAVHGGSLKFFTICPSSTQYTSSHYNLHNLYGLMMTKMSHNALLNARPNQRPFVISRSTYPGQGRYGGHWTGDNAATWHDLYASIPGILNFNLFGIPMVGADICGFRMNTTEPLCQRWYQLGAFYTFSRSHQERDTNSHDPTMFSKALIDSTRKAYLLRYSLLPYLYTLFYNSHTRGETVLRPLFFEYPKDKNTYGIDQQFMWGKCFLISPVLSENTTEIQGYFPKGSWYDIQTGSQQKSNGQYVTIATPLDKINVHLREGCVIVTQTPNLTTTMSRKNKFGLVVALLDDGKSEGELYADDGKSADSIQKSKYNRILFSASKKDRQITSAVDHQGYQEDMVLGNLTIFNIGTKPSQLTVNGVLCNFTFSQNQVINVEGLTADLKKRLTVKWT